MKPTDTPSKEKDNSKMILEDFSVGEQSNTSDDNCDVKGFAHVKGSQLPDVNNYSFYGSLAETSNNSNEELDSGKLRSDFMADNNNDNTNNEHERSLLLSSPSIVYRTWPQTTKKVGRRKKSCRPTHPRSQRGDPYFVLEKSRLNIFSFLAFNWFLPLMKLGNSKEQLDPEDLEILPLPPSCQADPVSKSFEFYWNMEKNKAKSFKVNGRQQMTRTWEPSVARCLFRAYGRDYVKAGILKLVHDINIFVGPVVLHGLIDFLSDPKAPLHRGLLLTVYVTLSQTIMSFCLRHYFFKCYLCGLRMRSAIVVQVYKKALVLSSAERQRCTVGEIMNLMTVDAQRIQDLTTYLHAIWYSFVQIGISLYFLWGQLGPSCLGGLAVILIMVPLNKTIASWMGNLQKSLMESRDVRVNMNNEVIGNMKEIKLHGWEDNFKERILLLRNIELRHLFRYVIANAFSIMMVSFGNFEVSRACSLHNSNWPFYPVICNLSSGLLCHYLLQLLRLHAMFSQEIHLMSPTL